MVQFDKGNRVMTNLGPGTVIYKRLKPHTDEAEVYSVCLDHKKAASELPPFPSYTGTIILAENVTKEDTNG